MAVYKFKITFEEFDDISRQIEIKASQSFLELHKSILSSIAFDDRHMASFYLSNDNWARGQEITMEDMSEGDDAEKSTPIMKTSLLQDFIDDPHQKLVYVYDFMEMWTLRLELCGIEMKDKPGIQYPFCSKSLGIAPKQYDKVQKLGLVEDSEFDELTKNYLAGSEENGTEISEDEADEFGLFDDEQGEANGEEQKEAE